MDGETKGSLPLPSLVSDQRQPALFPGLKSDVAFFLPLEAKGEFTGQRFFENRPDDYRRIVALLGMGWGSQRIADAFREEGKPLSKNTVKAVRAREGQTIDLVRERIATQSFEVAGDAFEAVSVIVGEIMSNPHRRAKLTMKDAQSLAVIGGIAVQNGQLLSGLPTARIETREVQTPEHDDFNAYLENLRTANPTDLSAEKVAQKEGARTGDAGTPDEKGVIEVPGAVPPDSQSTVSPTENQ